MSRRLYAHDTYPAAPLLAELVRRARARGDVDDNGQVTATALAELAGSHPGRCRIWLRRPDTPIYWTDADRFAVTLGLHPALIWPDWFKEEAA